jgi:peptidoglycan/xylan/chitin deacetylase (PgdA/CDA1 family)
MASPYPRDMVGYGAHPPDPKWPGEARVAVQFVLNYEEGSENCILHGDLASEAFLSEIVGAQPYAGLRHMNMESLYEYGSRAGFWRLHRLFTARAIPVTVYGVAMALERNPAKDSFDILYAEGETAPKMMSVGLHCRLVGRPGRTAALARFLDYVQGHERVWLCRRLDIAHHWRVHHPYSPSSSVCEKA